MIYAATRLARAEEWAELDQRQRAALVAGALAELAVWGPFARTSTRRLAGWQWVAVEYQR